MRRSDHAFVSGWAFPVNQSSTRSGGPLVLWQLYRHLRQAAPLSLPRQTAMPWFKFSSVLPYFYICIVLEDKHCDHWSQMWTKCLVYRHHMLQLEYTDEKRCHWGCSISSMVLVTSVQILSLQKHLQTCMTSAQSASPTSKLAPQALAMVAGHALHDLASALHALLLRHKNLLAVRILKSIGHCH